jgi:hypothetical protein
MASEPLDKQTVEKESGHGGRREGSGRPAFVPTDKDRKEVEALSGVGLPEEQIAILISGGISRETLRKYFERELVSGKARANSQVAKTLWQKAMSGDTTAAIWWTKTQMKWAETQKHQISGDADNPLQINIQATEMFESILKNAEMTRQIEE